MAVSQATNEENAALVSAMEDAFREVISFTRRAEFRKIFSEMMSLSPEQRHQFVRNVWLSPSELQARGLNVPGDLTIQRSAFRDNRPTLFCVTKYLPPGLPWSKVTVTIDNTEGAPAVGYEELAARDH